MIIRRTMLEKQAEMPICGASSDDLMALQIMVVGALSVLANSLFTFIVINTENPTVQELLVYHNDNSNNRIYRLFTTRVSLMNTAEMDHVLYRLEAFLKELWTDNNDALDSLTEIYEYYNKTRGKYI